MEKKVNEHELREYLDILISEFGFTIRGIGEDTGIHRSTISTWVNNPSSAYMLAGHLQKLNQYVHEVLFGTDGVTPEELKLLLQAKTLKHDLKIRRKTK